MNEIFIIAGDYLKVNQFIQHSFECYAVGMQPRPISVGVPTASVLIK